MQPVIVFNPIKQTAKAYASVASAARALNRDASTVHRALTGDRGCMSVANNLVIPVEFDLDSIDSYAG